ncbi:T9SS type A sorting domain-containing protein, partial [Fluviicola sp.]|uniref:T9SS type A sorting domain-containing protein n=1 Tax=Fluviicola sp. TaxID=1917219 RepID=UPI002607F11A
AYGNIYISETPWNTIRKIDPVSFGIAQYAGIPSATRGALGAYSGDRGRATDAQLFNPLDFVFDSFGNMYIGDSYNFVVRKVTPGLGGAISTIAGNNANTVAMLPDDCGHPKSIPIGVIRRVAIDLDNCVYMFNSQIPVIWKISEGVKIKNIDINTLCAPGTPGASVSPKLTAYVTGGVPPYTCYWTALPGNTVSLNHYDILSPEITGTSGAGKVLFDLLLEDNTGCNVMTSRKTNFSLNSSLTFDLAMRDSYLDMYDEPNSQNFDHSPWDPDIWNRVFPDDRVNMNQDPCFGGGSAMCNNHMYVTVRNMGCVASPAGKQVKMYWTVGGTEQKWPGNWTTDIYPGTSLPQGKEIAVITLPAMPAGSKQEFKQAWTAPDPVAYTGASNMGICFQGRIVDGHHGINTDGMSFEETEHVFRNMEYNNNIVLRNSKVVRIYHLPGKKLTVLAGNVESTSRVSSLSFSNRDITVSTLSQFAEITVYLGDIYDLWVAGGSLGIYQQTNPVAKTVTFNGTNEVRLDGILFPANYQYPVEMEFTLKPGADGTEMRTEYVYFQQFSNTQQGLKMHGSFEFIVTYDGEEAPAGAYRAEGTAGVEQAKALRDVKVFPNPASATVNFELPSVVENGMIVLVDVSGHEVARQTLKNQKTTNFDVKSLAPGVYIYRINAADMIQSGTVIVEK